VCQVERQPGTVIALLGPLLQPDFAGGDDRDFRHRKHAVRDHEQENDRDLEPHATHAAPLYRPFDPPNRPVEADRRTPCRPARLTGQC
jgi:hypothetical protein